LPYSTLKTALNIASEVLNKKLGKKISPKILAASILYFACQEERHPIILKEICKVIGLNKNETKKTMKVMVLIKQKVRKFSKLDIGDYVIRLVENLGLNDKVKEKALEIINKAKEKGITAGKNPIGLAAAAVYIAAKSLKISITQKEIAQKAFITDVTIRNRYKELLNALEGKININLKKKAKVTVKV